MRKGLAMIIAALGLCRRASTTEQQTKEIGIRKVIGASSSEIVLLLNKEFIFLVVLLILLALPIAGYIINCWSIGYAYHAPISRWIFVMVGCVALLVSWIIISFRTIRASHRNPAEVLNKNNL